MKFWQYLVGGMFALLIFAAALIVDNMQFLERNSFDNDNPFSLMGTSRVSSGGELQFLSSGELIWIDKEAELVSTDNERRLRQGAVVIGGTFFPTSEDTAITNKLWVGQTELYMGKTNVLVNFDSESETVTLMTGGGYVELKFREQETAFIMPAHSQMTFDPNHLTRLDIYLDYFRLKKEFALQPILIGELSDKLSQAEIAFSDIRSQFGHFAWNLPTLWKAQGGLFLRFLENITLRLPATKEADRVFSELTEPLRLARETINNSSSVKILQKFKDSIAINPLWEKSLQNGEQIRKEWQWFELAQKIWLPVVSPDSAKQQFAALWDDTEDFLCERMRAIILLSYNGHWSRVNTQLEEFTKEVAQAEFTQEDVLKLTHCRRFITSLIETYPIHKTFSNFDLWVMLAREEQKLFLPEQKEKISLEVAHEIIEFVTEFLQEESGSSISKLLNKLWFELGVSKEDLSFSEAEKTTIDLINLVGETGMTPLQIRRFHAQQAEEAFIEEQLQNIDIPEEVIVEDLGISGPKKLWEFLSDSKIALDLASFRSNRTETIYTTRFANTEAGKRKIEGVFDYHAQEFVTLTLGEEMTADLPAHRLGYWITLIGGKFEFDKVYLDDIEKEGVNQKKTQAVLAKMLVKKLLESIGIDVQQDQLEMKDEEYNRCAILEADYNGAKISAEYNIITQEFADITIEKAGESVSDVGICDIDGFIEKIENSILSISSEN